MSLWLTFGAPRLSRSSRITSSNMSASTRQEASPAMPPPITTALEPVLGAVSDSPFCGLAA
jgi:hypothetical protein